MRYLSTLALLLPSTLATYSVVDDYTNGNFANQFDFFTGNDPTNGYVNYVDYSTAQASGLYSVSNNRVYIGVDHNNTASGRGRNSVRISSKKSYQHGLIILDLAHMPGGACGTWPAFWLLSSSAQWPNGGEIDIIEGVNSQSYNTMAAHTNAGCSISDNGGMSGQILTSNCDVNAQGQAANQGCSIKSTKPNTFGSGFNSNGGGVYATEWTSNGISIWFFPRNAIPSDISSGKPDTSGWGVPISRFAGNCDWDKKVVNQQIMFDVTFCGDWAGNVWGSDDTCKSKSTTCQAYVQQNPSAFADTYWSINSLKVYQQNGQSSTSRTSVSTVTQTSTSSTYSTSRVSTTQSATTSFVTSTRTATSTSVSSTTQSTTSVISSTSSQSSLLASSATTGSSSTSVSTSSSILIPTSSTTIQATTPFVTSVVITVTATSAPATTPPTTSSYNPVTTQSTPAQPTATASTTFNTWAPNSQWQGWPNTFYTVTRAGGWGGENGGRPGNWGGSGGWGRPTGA